MRDHLRCNGCGGCLTCGIHTNSVTCNGTSSTHGLVSYNGPPLSDEQVAELRADFRASLRRDGNAAIAARAGFGPVPDRIEVTYCTEYCGDECVCSLRGLPTEEGAEDG